MAERLQKVLARAGFGSRREIESWIREGRITINGNRAELGVTVGEHDRVSIDGRAIKFSVDPARDLRTLIYHKPAGELTTRKDEAGRPTVFESLPSIRNGRWVSIGRLDMNTSGLLLATTDGELAHRLMHPSYEIEREYAVRVLGEVSEHALQNLLEGVQLEDGMASFTNIRDAGGQGANHWYHVTVSEGRNREVRRLWESQGLQVSRLIRVRFGPIALPPGIRAGRFRDLTREETVALYTSVGLPVPKTKRSEPRPGGRRGRRVR